MDHQTTHIAILPSPGISHLIPFAEFAKRLVLHHNFHVTCIIATTADDQHHTSTKALLDTLPDAVDSIFLPPVSFEDLPRDTKPAVKLSLTITRSLPSLHHVLKSLLTSTTSTRLVAFLTDLFCFEALEVAKGLNLSPYVFFPTNFMALSFFFHLPKLDETVSCRFMRDLPDPVKLPGCVPLYGEDLPDPVQDRESEGYEWLLNISKRLVSSESIIVNSFVDLESEALKSLQEEEGDGTRKPLIYSVGPITQTGSTSSNDESDCLSWLDKQPRGSVLYVSFGSGGTLSSDQLTELAFGLEMSGQNFLWVVRSPDNKSAHAAYLSGHSQFKASDFLPNGFLERTRGKGLVVPSWAPQAQVLSHGSTGGFVSHCGWSSTLESIVNGIPLIAWPLYAEQKMNAVMLVDGLKVALRPKAEENGIVRREEIAKVVKVLMDQGSEEGKRIRDRMKDLKDAAAKALSKDGSSTRALSDLAFALKNKSAN